VADDKQVTVLIGLDLSAAFDTVDHRLLLDRLQMEFRLLEIQLRWLQSYLEGGPSSRVPQGSVLAPLLFAVDVIAHRGVQYHQYADDVQLHLTMRTYNTPSRLSVLAECTTDVRQWCLQNYLQLNPDKSEALITGTTNQLRASVSSVSMAGVDLPVADDIVLDRRLSFHKHISVVV